MDNRGAAVCSILKGIVGQDQLFKLIELAKAMTSRRKTHIDMALNHPFAPPVRWLTPRPELSHPSAVISAGVVDNIIQMRRLRGVCRCSKRKRRFVVAGVDPQCLLTCTGKE